MSKFPSFTLHKNMKNTLDESAADCVNNIKSQLTGK